MAPITFGILTISDTCFADKSKDASGPKAEVLVTNTSTETGAILRGKISCRDIIPDDETLIMKTLIKWSDKENVNVILTTGGTGFSERDVTPEATKRVIEKEAPGISMAMFKRSLEVTPMAMLSRAVCGIRGKTLIINMPGSPGAVSDCLNTIARVIPHAIALISGDKTKVAEDHKNALILGDKSKVVEVHKNISKSETSPKYRELEIAVSDLANRQRQSPYPMISLDEAVSIYRSVCRPFGSKEVVSVEEAHGRILATAVHSCCDLPPFRASIKDGYAVIASDGKGSRRVLGGVEAGHTPGSAKLTSGSCVRVNTGAPIPDEATAVVQVEDTVHTGGSSGGKEETVIEILVAPTEGQDIRPVGCDIKKGALVLDVHTKIGPAEMGVLAACGVTKVEVTKLPTVGILSTGNELQTAGEPAKPGHVYDSNKITLMATLKESGYSAVDFGIVRDDLGTMIAGIERALDRVDVLITSGSVSMGDKDLLKPILTKVFGARIHFGRVALKPGKPTTFASCDYGDSKKYLLCLPGNPVSAMVTAHLFAIPVLHRLAGNYSSPVEVLAELTADYKLDPRPEFARAVLIWEHNSAIPKAYITGNQISSKLLSCKTANALLKLPGKTADKPAVKSGDRVSAMLLGFDINLVTVNQDKSSEINYVK